jgi:transcriptional regulator with XRE-family HTH domain
MGAENIKERLIQFLEYKHISKTEFGKIIGVSTAFVTSIRKSIQPDKIESIALNFPELNIEWLTRGIGNMINSNESQSLKETQSENNLVISREVFDTISKLTETVLSQQRTIESMQKEKMNQNVRMEDNVISADAK